MAKRNRLSPWDSKGHGVIMRVGAGQLLCLALGVLFLAVGGGMLGGRYALERYGNAHEIASPPEILPAEGPFVAPEEGEPVVEEPAGESQSKYVIQAMSTSNRDDARAARDTILAAGFRVGIFEADLPGRGKWYRVYVGPYEREGEARRAIGEVRSIPGFEGSFLKEREQ